MYGIRGSEPPGRGRSGSPASPSKLTTCSAIPSDADSPVERMPATHAYRRRPSTEIT
jgi:hypothetical protein